MNHLQRVSARGPLNKAVLAAALLGFVVSPAHSDRMGAAKPTRIEPATPPSANWRTRHDYSRVRVSLPMELSALSDTESAATLERSNPGTPYRQGIGREIPEAYRGDLAKSVQWVRIASGAQVASFSVRSPGAQALRLGLRAALPAGGIVRFFQTGGSEVRYPILKAGDFANASKTDTMGSHEGIAAPRTRWSPTVSGDSVGIEIEIPSSADPAAVEFNLVRASHLWRSPDAPPSSATIQRKTSHACDPIDVACKSTPDCPRGAVARIFFTEADGASYVCSGTAVNSSRSEFDNFDNPFFLTANHCISSQSGAESAETRWHYEYQTCGGTVLDPGDTTLWDGADLVIGDADADGTLLRLRNALPAGACLAGWNAEPGLAPDTPVTSIHHPEGNPKSWAGGTVDRVTIASTDEASVDVIAAQWTEGGTLPGSSGSGLFVRNDDGEDELVGMLVGGSPDDCSLDFYGRFDRFFANGAHPHLLPGSGFPADDHGGGAADATGVFLNSTIDGTIDDGADADVFRIAVTEFGTLTVYTSGSLDTFGRLKRQDGSTLAMNDDDGSDFNFRIEIEVEPGTYFIKVTGFNHYEVGDYRLHVEFEGSSPPAVLVPIFPSAVAIEETGREGFVRVTNRSSRSGAVTITAVDDEGNVATDEAGSQVKLALDLNAHETKNFNSRDFESVNANKGLSGADRLSPGRGHWRLRLNSVLDIDVAAFIRTEDGFLTSIHDVVAPDDYSHAHYVSIFNPASNDNQRSQLRLINESADRTVNVSIDGYDDAGATGDATVELEIPPGAARLLSAMQLENGGAGLTGGLGDGKGKWRLLIAADGEIVVVNLLESPTGNLTNLSTIGASNHSR